MNTITQLPAFPHLPIRPTSARRRRGRGHTLHVLLDPGAKCRRCNCREPAVFVVRYWAVLNQSQALGERADPVCVDHANRSGASIEHLPGFLLAFVQAALANGHGRE
jgi:hypothetical protein